MNKIHVLIFISIITILGLTSTFAINSIIKNNEIKREQEDIQKLSDIKSVLQEVVKEDEVNDYIDIKLSKRERIIFWLGASGELSLDDIKKNHESRRNIIEISEEDVNYAIYNDTAAGGNPQDGSGICGNRNQTDCLYAR